MASPPGSSSLFDTKTALTAAKFKLLARAYINKDLRKAGASAYCVLIYAVEKAGDDGRFWKKVSTIARDIGIDRSTVKRAMKTLTYHGFIERKGRHNGVGNSCNVYRLALDLDVATRAAKREGRRRTKYPRRATKDERAKAAIVRGLALDIGAFDIGDENRREQVANSTGKPPLRGCSPAPLEGATPRPQRAQPCATYISLPDNPSLDSFRSTSLEGEKQVVQQGSGEGFEDLASIGEVVASVTIPPGEPSPPLDTFDPSTSSPDEPLSSTLTADRDAVGAEGPDHAQRSLGPMLVITGGLEKQAAAGDIALAPLLAAKKVAIDAIGKGKFLKRDLVLNHLLAAVPDDARDGLRAREYLEWANELVEDEMGSVGAAPPAASGGAA